MNRQCFFGYGLSPSRNLSVAIASNWIEAYKTYVSPNPPSLPQLASPSASESPLNPDEVWVNTKSGKYWKPGSRYYGKTKQGEYMSEQEAIQKEYQPASNLYLIV
jgi:hypothetical protein